MSENKFRLVTRSDFDGLVCAALLSHLDLVDEVSYVHPKDVQDGRVEITPNDITTNLPYSPNAHLVFDHHVSELTRVEQGSSNHVLDPHAPSAARVVFDHYGGFESFPLTWEQMMNAVDQADSAQYSREDIMKPSGWTLLNFLMDSRTGLGRFRDFRVSNYQLMIDLVDYCRFQNIDDIFEIPDVQDRVELYLELQDDFTDQLRRCGVVHNDLVCLDMRAEETIYPGNRFMVYAVFPECNISLHTLWGMKRQNTVFAVGKSILDRSNPVDIGTMLLEYGGGGHANAGTCQVPNDDADRVYEQLLARLSMSSDLHSAPVERVQLAS
ncbi:MAG: exopolyphosphatase [Gammaproteobacteria bacterium]|nr:exopolyphosphatase [Gammaproteobacteria bacterium]